MRYPVLIHKQQKYMHLQISILTVCVVFQNVHIKIKYEKYSCGGNVVLSQMSPVRVNASNCFFLSEVIFKEVAHVHLKTNVPVFQLCWLLATE